MDERRKKGKGGRKDRTNEKGWRARPCFIFYLQGASGTVPMSGTLLLACSSALSPLLHWPTRDLGPHSIDNDNDDDNDGHKGRTMKCSDKG
jgi:hypothetical protein